jgi:hypothetical protein
MKRLCLLGKQYDDTIMIVDSLKQGETNDCSALRKKKGGVYNFFEAKMNNWDLKPFTRGIKKAYIISNKETSTRTSIVIDEEISTISSQEVQTINNNFDWMHVCYIDDMECYLNLRGIEIPFSLDFCTDSPRAPFFYLLNRAEIVFDSRERKYLYDNIFINTPIIFHDDGGFEVVVDGSIVHSESITPLKNLNVNGAGDIYAGRFLDHYLEKFDAFRSAKLAAEDTTNLLLHRKD